MSETTDTSLGFPLKGTLRRNPFPKLVRQLARSKSTGSLYLLNGKTKKVVFFDRGEPVSVRSNVTTECLGQILAREGLITQAQCDQTLESIRRTGKKQGELLIEMGILSEGNLRYGLEAQLRHKLFDIFSWEDGRYQYKPDLRGDDYGLRFTTDAQGLILTALLETADEARALAALQPYADRFPLIDPEHELHVEVTPEEHYFLLTLDGSSNIGELLELPADPPVPSAALLLYAAIQAGLAKLAKGRRPARERPPKPEDGRTKPEHELEPGYAPRLTITTYEDTPLPGELPKAPDPELDDDFGDGDDESDLHPGGQREIDSQLVAAERDTPDETFEEDLELGDEPSFDDSRAAALVADPAESGVFQRVLIDDDDESLPPLDDEAHALPAMDAVEPPLLEPPPADATYEVEEIEEIEEIESIDDEELETEVSLDAAAGVPTEVPFDRTPDTGVPAPASASASDLEALANLEVDDDLTLDGSLAAVLSPEELAHAAELAAAADELVGLEELDDIELPLEAPLPAELDPDYDPATAGALQFAEGETAIAERRFAAAVSHFEAAYEHGFDVAELHALLAWARFQASDESPTMADHALELLAYAEGMNPALALVHAYRSAILFAQGDHAGAQDAAQAALDIDPYDELAIDVMDRLV